MRFSIVLAAPLIAAVTFIGQPASPKDSDGIAAAVADPARPEADRQRDANRKPAECLAFAGVKPGDRVAELMPGGGYCLAPTHALQDNSPTENVVAMYATALEEGKY